MKSMIDIHPETARALAEGHAVVALESTIISHGMPYPDNLEMVENVERIIRQKGAFPATIAVIDGRIKVGLTDVELNRLATDKNVRKASKRDLGYLIAMRKSGALTVAATMLVAKLAGIRVFATGGIGGVHRGATKTLDISRDLEELSETEVAVVCAGAKSILDLGLTLEYLETKGVEVIGYKTDFLPAFYTRKSEHGVDFRLDKPEEIAALMVAKWHLPAKGGLVIANPIPEEDSLDEAFIDEIIDEALAEAETKDIQGKAITPFLLDAIKEKTGGASLQANLALVYNNAALATDIAIAYAALADRR